MSTRLLADLGGTHVRFALAGEGGGPSAVRVLECRAYPGFADAIHAYLSGLDSPPPPNACFAVATIDTGERIGLTNNSWTFTLSELKTRFGFRHLVVVNDFAAVAYALPHLRSHQVQPLTPQLPGDPSNALALGAGTGLGGARLAEGKVIPCEPGHAALGPGTALEYEVFALLQSQWPEIYAELLVSGPGLERLHQALAQVRDRAADRLTAAQISRAAMEDTDTLCREALEIFCALLGSAAGDFTVSCGAYGGVYLAGGIVPKVLPFLRGSSFLSRFTQKGAMRARLQQVPVFAIVDPQPGLTGAAVYPLPDPAPG